MENETVIREVFSRLIRDKTATVIAHPVRTVSGADRMVMLFDGTVAGKGASKALLARKGSVFHRMAQLQTASADRSI